ncbi:type IV secretion system protein [Bartonella florencae]|uniref:type IV secretion system protein n=1 Tax=Bartonella florencae TaxID=928210 RepID=UPI0002F9019F|nr:type IV secretion system protein [Bartonella florencae]
MNFQMFSKLFSEIDRVTNTYIMDISSKTIIAITPIVSIGLTLGFIIYGWLVIRGAIDTPLAGLVNRFFRISVITSIALSAGLYQSDIKNLIKETPNDLVKTLVSNSAPKNNPKNKDDLAKIIDKVAEKGFECASKAFEEAAFLDADGLLYGLFGILILLATSFLTAVGGAFILIANVAITLLVGLGPFFIVSLLWQPTYRFFEQWIAQILNYTILILLLATMSGLLMNIFANYMTDFKFDGQQNVSYALGGALILSIISIVILFKLSSIASALAKGVTLGHLWKSNIRS